MNAANQPAIATMNVPRKMGCENLEEERQERSGCRAPGRSRRLVTVSRVLTLVADQVLDLLVPW